jgi:hypothetical protein
MHDEEPAAHASGWHWIHYPIGIFLVAYGAAGIPLLVIGWSDRHQEMATYLDKTFGLGIATPALAGAKLVEALLTLLALAGLLRRRDVWYLPALLGWAAGFAAFCVLDLWSGRYGGLAEHVVYLFGFLLLLAASFAFGVKARVAHAEAGPGVPAGRAAHGAVDGAVVDAADEAVTDRAAGRAAGTRMRLTRTQELALAALNRWQRSPTPPR